MTFEFSPAPGRYPFPLSPRWTAVAIVPVPGFVAVGLFLDGEPVEVLTDPDEVASYLRLVGATPRERAVKRQAQSART